MVGMIPSLLQILSLQKGLLAISFPLRHAFKAQKISQACGLPAGTGVLMWLTPRKGWHGVFLLNVQLGTGRTARKMSSEEGWENNYRSGPVASPSFLRGLLENTQLL